MNKQRIEQLNTANSSLLFLIAVMIIISCVEASRPFVKYLYSIPFFGMSILIFLKKKKVTPRITAIFFIIVAGLCIAFGDQGNLTGALFISYAVISIFSNRKIMIISAISTVILILAKSIYSNWTLAQTMIYMVGFIYSVAIYYILNAKRKASVVCREIDYETAEILELVLKGKTYKEIGDLRDVGKEAISKRVANARKQLGATCNMDLGAIMATKGYIVL